MVSEPVPPVMVPATAAALPNTNESFSAPPLRVCTVLKLTVRLLNPVIVEFVGELIVQVNGPGAVVVPAASEFPLDPVPLNVSVSTVRPGPMGYVPAFDGHRVVAEPIDHEIPAVSSV